MEREDGKLIFSATDPACQLECEHLALLNLCALTDLTYRSTQD